jgi:hypothetical protein
MNGIPKASFFLKRESLTRCQRHQGVYNYDLLTDNIHKHKHEQGHLRHNTIGILQLLRQ